MGRLGEKSRQLYDVLCAMTLDEAKSVIREVHGRDGMVQALAKKLRAEDFGVHRRYREVMNPVSAKDLCEGGESDRQVAGHGKHGSLGRGLPARNEGTLLPDRRLWPQQ